MWTTDICDFIDENCVLFAGSVDDENSLEFTGIHNRFRKLVDLKLDEFCHEFGIQHHEFMVACS